MKDISKVFILKRGDVSFYLKERGWEDDWNAPFSSQEPAALPCLVSLSPSSHPLPPSRFTLKHIYTYTCSRPHICPDWNPLQSARRLPKLLNFIHPHKAAQCLCARTYETVAKHLVDPSSIQEPHTGPNTHYSNSVGWEGKSAAPNMFYRIEHLTL